MLTTLFPPVSSPPTIPSGTGYAISTVYSKKRGIRAVIVAPPDIVDMYNCARLKGMAFSTIKVNHI